MVRHCRLNGGRGAAERYAGGLELERELEQFGGELRRGADAGIGDGVLEGIGLEQIDQLLHRLDRNSGFTTRIFGEAAASVTGSNP